MLEENDRIRAMEERKRENPTMMKNRRSLPAWQERDRIVRAVRDNQVSRGTVWRMSLLTFLFKFLIFYLFTIQMPYGLRLMFVIVIAFPLAQYINVCMHL